MLIRATVIEELADLLKSATVVAPLGNTVRELYAIAESPSTFYLLGSMGMPVPVALGLAMGHSGTVIALEGDGGCLTNMGSLATAARYAPGNLKIVILDNGAYESTGGQPTHSHAGTSFVDVARGCGIKAAREVRDETDLADLPNWLALPGLRLAVVKTVIAETSFPRVPLAPPDIFRRVREHLAQTGSAAAGSIGNGSVCPK